jgi:5-methylthioadenosine/S-adenosylhomocysteine deaminase
MLRMATIEGARALNLDHDIGSLEAGKKADLLLLDLHGANLAPVALEAEGGSLLWNLVFAAGPANVDSVWVDGRQVLSRGAPLAVSGPGIVTAAQSAGLSLQARCRELAHTRTEMR